MEPTDHLDAEASASAAPTRNASLEGQLNMLPDCSAGLSPATLTERLESLGGASKDPVLDNSLSRLLQIRAEFTRAPMPMPSLGKPSLHPQLAALQRSTSARTPLGSSVFGS